MQCRETVAVWRNDHTDYITKLYEYMHNFKRQTWQYIY